MDVAESDSCDCCNCPVDGSDVEFCRGLLGEAELVDPGTLLEVVDFGGVVPEAAHDVDANDDCDEELEDSDCKAELRCT